MNEVTAPQAAEILGLSTMTIHRKVDQGVLPARQQGSGERLKIFVEVDDLRKFAEKYSYRFDEAAAQQYANAE